MPIVLGTMASQSRRRKIEEMLDELEKALDHFGKRTVLVAIEDVEDAENRGPKGQKSDAKERWR